MRKTLLGLLLLALAPVLAAQAPTWSDEVVERFASLPVQDGGRVKPLDTYAQFRLLRMNGKRSFRDGETKVTPTPWLLTCLFRPDHARTQRVFLVRDAAVLEALGVRVEGRKKSDRYSYDEIAGNPQALNKLFREAGRIEQEDPKERDSLENQTLLLAINIHDFERLIHAMEFARGTLPTNGTELLREVYGDEPTRGVAAFLEGLPELSRRLEELDGTPDLGQLGTVLESLVAGSSGLALFPPEAVSDEEWLPLSAALDQAWSRHAGHSSIAGLIQGWEALETTKDDPAAFAAALESFHRDLVGRAEARGEYSRIPLELSYYRADFFTRALVFFLLAFVLVAASWLAPKVRWLQWGIWGTTGIGAALLVGGVTMRCIIRGRPPISTLYETILFVSASVVLLCLFIEWAQRGRIAQAVGPVLGAAGMFLAMKYELKEAASAGDTMPSLVAVLDTNFWLATHVTTITLGYAAGLLAAALSNLWLIGRMIGLRNGDEKFFGSLTRMIYGVVCFGLIFSVVGTILGGIWANYSWGRFWGWDPKENGALLICLGGILTLHARLGGYIRDFGLAVLTALNGLTVAFSWWHVNNLGVGLHSYGKAEGVILALYTYYGLGLVTVAAALLWRAWSPAAASLRR
jgi:ABC-type transport system involved in cytochrome c biogenesis permease subunit